VSALWLALWLVPVIALVAALGRDDIFSQIAVLFSKMSVVTFGGAYAGVSLCRATGHGDLAGC